MEIGQSREDYLKTIYILTLMDGSVRQTEIAEYMEVSRPSVSVAIRLLEENGYITYWNRNIKMTKKGRELAENIYARHLFFTRLLVRAGVGENKAKKEACGMEHVLSEDSYQKLKSYLKEMVV